MRGGYGCVGQIELSLLALRGVQIDPAMAALLAQVPGADKINNTDVGDGRNTAGYRLNQRSNETQDNVHGTWTWSGSGDDAA